MVEVILQGTWNEIFNYTESEKENADKRAVLQPDQVDPSLTLPPMHHHNHYTLTIGRYPSHHQTITR